jgi:predicted Fe-S protein YdhL (DUF1289 family)
MVVAACQLPMPRSYVSGCSREWETIASWLSKGKKALRAFKVALRRSRFKVQRKVYRKEIIIIRIISSSKDK